MARDTNTLKCQETESGCKKIRYGSCVSLTKAFRNSGFILDFDVECTGFLPTKEQVISLGKYLSICMKKVLDRIASDHAMSDIQKELF